MHDDTLIDATMQAVHQIARSVWALSSSHPVLADRSPAQIRALGFLSRNKEQTVGELAEMMGVTISTASGLVDKLVDNGLVERSTNPDDRRQVLIRLAPAAIEMNAQIKEIRRRQVLSAVDSLDSQQRACFVDSIQAIARALADLNPADPDEVRMAGVAG
jgi:DNA-binding MarR family transcriptional regulator